jgi:hypothetical protein
VSTSKTTTSEDRSEEQARNRSEEESRNEHIDAAPSVI